jgi:Polyketide cyclase / dehydrase and lipid transport
MNVRAICEGGFTLPLPVAEALVLFTPEGERRWAGSDWNPQYAIAEAVADDSAPGTVFTTESDGGHATWIVLERRPDGMRYARVAPRRIAGTVSVSCAPSPEGTQVRVTYDVTSLGPEGAEFVRELESGYHGFMESWREEIVKGVALPDHH